MKDESNDVKPDIDPISAQLSGLVWEQVSFETVGRNMEIVMACSIEISARINKQLAKLDGLEGIKKCIETLNYESSVSRNERALRQRGKQS